MWYELERTPCRKKRGVPLGKGGTNVETPGGGFQPLEELRQNAATTLKRTRRAYGLAGVLNEIY